MYHDFIILCKLIISFLVIGCVCGCPSWFDSCALLLTLFVPLIITGVPYALWMRAAVYIEQLDVTIVVADVVVGVVLYIAPGDIDNPRNSLKMLLLSLEIITASCWRIISKKSFLVSTFVYAIIYKNNFLIFLYSFGCFSWPDSKLL